ncbi:MAG: carboxypeptidase-like regulatory domain-containing protein [Balneolaceae bacterium]|nr:carboxypeptidase-like regulatory domain-containing protein [Balneolaceae bacterium]
MKIRYGILLLSSISLLILSCSKETITPELYGSIDGRVLASKTDEGLGGVNITTSPATNSIITNSNGSFSLNEVPTGNYSINAEKSGYSSSSVSVKVREDRKASAQIYMKQVERNNKKYLSAEVTSWNARAKNDSTFVEVEFMVQNTSSETDIGTYEIYFEIFTDGPEFYYEVRDSSLSAGERNIQNFEKFIRNNKVDSVQISDTYTSE